MKFSTDDLDFDGEMGELIELALLSHKVWNALKCSKFYVNDMGDGRSFTLDSFETWDDDEKPN